MDQQGLWIPWNTEVYRYDKGLIQTQLKRRVPKLCRAIIAIGKAPCPDDMTWASLEEELCKCEQDREATPLLISAFHKA